MEPCADIAGGAILSIKARPRSSKPGIAGVEGDAVVLRIRSAPVDGKANREIVELLADTLGVAKSRISFVSGETSKTKRVKISGIDAKTVMEAIG
ncbi:MAG: DUF167 domain-containing protein [Kiritimatiellae bacterium]|nr:DUF167 domain-containing protein [Kiritimatiellia bacterium]